MVVKKFRNKINIGEYVAYYPRAVIGEQARDVRKNIQMLLFMVVNARA